MPKISEEFGTSVKIDEVTAEAIVLMDLLVEGLNGKKMQQSQLAETILYEHLLRADWRFGDLQKSKIELSQEAGKEEWNIRLLQMRFIDNSESFHRQVYGTLSVLVLLMSHACPRPISSQLPIGSVQKFLNHISNTIDTEEIERYKNNLLASVQYRAAFIDHPQQSKLHNWMTMETTNETVIIHYVPFFDGDEIIEERDEQTQSTNPREDNFRPLIRCSSFQVSPNYAETYMSLCNFVLRVLQWCVQRKKT